MNKRQRVVCIGVDDLLINKNEYNIQKYIKKKGP